MCSSSRQRTMARLPSLGMMKDSEEEFTLRGWTEIPYFALMSQNMRPSQSFATVAIRSGTMPSLAQQKAAVTALPPKETAYGSIEGLMNHFMLIMEGYGIRPPAGEAYFATEGANGELGFYVVSDGGDRPYRVRCRPPCLPPLAALHRMVEGEMIADLIPTFGSVNMIGGELDR